MVEMTGFADRLDVGYHMKKEKMALMFWSGVNAVGIYQDGGNLPGVGHCLLCYYATLYYKKELNTHIQKGRKIQGHRTVLYTYQKD